MKKVKYYYDTESLAYKRIKTKKSTKIGLALLFLISSMSFGFILFLFFAQTSLIEGPKNKIQHRELENLKVKYTLLNNQIENLTEVLNDIEERDNNLYRMYFNASPIEEDERKKGLKEKDYSSLAGFDNSELIIETTKKTDILSKEIAIQSKSLDYILNLAKKRDKLLLAIPAIQPVKTEQLKRMASGFGYRSDPFTKAKKFHQGMDFAAQTGTPIYATGDGRVERADNGASGYGNHIVINHGFGYQTLYGHLSKYNCRAGQNVKRGDIIGFVGSTGRSEGPHLHYEVHKDGNVVNPLNFYYANISAIEYVAISRIANQENQSLD